MQPLTYSENPKILEILILTIGKTCQAF